MNVFDKIKDLENDKLIFDQSHIRKQIAIQKTSILFKNLVSAIFASMVCATLVYIALFEQTERSIYLNWYMAMIFVSALRIGLLLFYFKKPDLYKLQQSLFMLGAIIAAMLWGAIGSVMMPDSFIERMIILIVVAGVAAGGLQSLQPSLTTNISFLSLVLAPVCVWSFLQNERAFLILGTAITMYLIFLLLTAIRNNKLLNDALKLHFENLILVEELSSTNNVLKESNNTLQLHETSMTIINEMNQMLQLCQNSKEAYDIIKHTAQQLFVDTNGTLAITNKQTHHEEVAISWGEPSILTDTFPISACWAFRSSTTHNVDDPTVGILCNHFKAIPSGSYMSVIMQFDGQFCTLIDGSKAA